MQARMPARACKTAAIALLLLQGVGCGGQSRAGPRTGESPTTVNTQRPADGHAGERPVTVNAQRPADNHAVVYIRRRSHHPEAMDSFEAIWQRLGDHDGRVVYETGRDGKGEVKSGPSHPPPVGFGILPSPDGRWLHVWESVYRADGTTRKTVWSVVEVSTGRRLKISELPVDRIGYFPYWLDAHTLSLEKGDWTSVFDVTTGRLTNPLSVPQAQPYPYGARDIDGMTDAPVTAWRHKYVQRHYASELGALESALAAFGTELGVSAYLRKSGGPSQQDARASDIRAPDTPEDLLLRAFGLVGWVPGRRSKEVWPGVAVSPDLTMLARTAFVATGRQTAKGLFGRPYHGYTSEARLDLYRLGTGEHLWGQSSSQRQPQFDQTAYYSSDPWFKDPRWSGDGRYLAFVTQDEPSRRETVSVLDTSSWEIVLRIPDAMDAFVVPAVPERVDR
jgi:hypothetical protein